MDSIGLKLTGYQSLLDLSMLGGRTEQDLRQLASRLDIVILQRFGQEVLAMDEARRILAAPSSTKRLALPPGFSVSRLVALMRRAITATGLDLSDMTVLTEAATGAYGVTAPIAAMAGAKRVYAFTRPSQYGSVAEVTDWISQLAREAGVTDRIDVVDELSPDMLGEIDIVTNSGHLRPITADMIRQLPKSSVVALMFEAWEFRPEDIDLAACIQRDIPVVGVNERHNSVDVFSFLGPLCAKVMHEAGLPVCNNKIALVCDNDFAEPVARGLEGLGADLHVFSDIMAVNGDSWDALVIAVTPTRELRLGHSEAQHLATVLPPEAVTIQFWGDMDRQAMASRGLTVWPHRPPRLGHMGALLSEIGPDPIVRLQTGGLRAAEWVWRGGTILPGGFAQIVHPA